MRLHSSPNVFFEEIQGFLIILNLQTEAYYILDPVGTSMWKALLGTHDQAEALRALQNEYSVEPIRLKTDFEAFGRSCIENGFLDEGETAPRSEVPFYVEAAHPRFLILSAWWCLFRTVRLLSAAGFSRTYREYSRIPIPKDNSGDVDNLLRRALSAFATAENFFLIKSAPKDCLPRSLALFRFLRSAGLPVEHCIGVRRFPFQAHAWVEYHGSVVQDNPSQQSVFRTLARISACKDS
jgi:Transglutaminase-like superfamily/Coenzyme PQQ synthesis protein D (PqqD)